MTNKVVLRTVEEFMTDYTPIYQPMYPLLLGKSQSYAEEVGKIDFKRVSAVGDIRAKHITPKDTEIRQISATDAKKTFKKYFLANQYVESDLQDQQNIEEIVAQVLDEHQKQADELMLFGEGTDASTMINNGLYWSNDPNYTLETSAELDTDADTGGLIALHNAVIASALKADVVAGRKAIVFYGSLALAAFNGLYAAQPVPFKRVLADVLGSNYSFLSMPADVTPASSYGYIVVNLDQVKTHYTTLPSLKDQGVNSEKMYAWFNFLMGSMMVEVLAKNAVIRQPITFEA
jgi:hypothetical protein